MKIKFIISIVFSLLMVASSYYILTDWIKEVETIFGFGSYIILGGMVFIPCFYTFFVFTTLVFTTYKKFNVTFFPTLTILIAVYNEEDTIFETLQSIVNQNYLNKVQIIVANDGSQDNSVKEIQRFIRQYNGTFRIDLIDNKVNKGKSAVLNQALEKALYDIIVTVDSDTILYKDALTNIVSKLLSDNYSAVAGAVRVNNSTKNFITRIQKYDYLYGIGSVKMSQGLFNTTLVAQGAFSCYRKEVVKHYKWCETMGEDIVLSWDMLSDGHKIGYCPDAVVFTNAPETYKNFFNQRKRWSIGLIEAFRRNLSVLYKPSYGLPFFWNNFLFIYIDLAFAFFFVPSIIMALFFKVYLLAGILTLLLIPLGILMNGVIIYKQYSVNKRLGLTSKFDLLGFLSFILFYQFIQTPACIVGYVSEALYMKKDWGTRKIS